MKTALTCALFGILFFGSQCSSNEQESTPTPQEELYKRHYQNASGLCGSWYRNESTLESIYNCTVQALDLQGYPIVNTTWEGLRHKYNWTIPRFVGFMCNFTVAMPEEFYFMFAFEEGLEQERMERSGDDSVTTEAPRVPERELTYAEGNCSEKINAKTTPAPTTPFKPAVVAIE